MRKSLCSILILTAVNGCATGPEAIAPHQASIEQFIKIRWPGNGELAANGYFYYIDLKDGVRQLFRRAPGQRNATAITDFQDGIGGYTLSPDGRRIAITAGRGGDEQYDIHLMDAATEQIKPILVDRETVFGSVVWDRDSRTFAYRANKESKEDFHVFIYFLSSGESERVWADAGYWYPVDFNEDRTKLVVGKYVSAAKSYLWELSLIGLGARPLTPTDEWWSFSGVGYDEDATHLLVVSNHGGDRKRLQRINLSTNRIEAVLPQFDNNDMDYAVLNLRRDTIATVVNTDGFAELHLFSLPDFKPLPGPPIAEGVVGNISFQGDTLLYALNNANTPGLIYRWEMGKADSKPVAMTEADTRNIDLDSFAFPKLIKYRSFDGLEIPAFLYLPPHHEGRNAIPFIVSYHGGPESQYRPRFSRVFQYFLSRGFGVLAPNVRGSSGYGTAYVQMDNYKKRMDSVKDGVAAARWLVDNGYSAPKMIAAYGGSYGGFMVMAVITQAPELFGAACNVVGIVNFETFLKRTKAYRRKLREAEYGPLTDPDFLESISPIHLIDRIQTPVLIAHGRNDPRVPIHEAEQLHAAMKERGLETEIIVFDDEGHGFRKEANRIVFYRKLVDFFEKHLK